MNLLNLTHKLIIISLILTVLILAKGFLMPLVVAAVISALFLPICKRLESKKINSVVAVSICVLLFTSIIAIILWVLINQVSGILENFELLKQRLLLFGNEIRNYLFEKIGISFESQLDFFNNQKNIFSNLIPSIAGSFIGTFINFFLITVYMFCFLLYRNHLKLFILKVSKSNNKTETEVLIHKVSNVSQQYLLGLAKMIFLLWVMYGIAFSIIGVKNALFFAMLCGVLEIVPFIGNLTGTLITLLIAAAQGLSTPLLLSIIGTYGLIQFIQGWLLEPLILGPQVKLNPYFTIIALIIGDLIWGLSGIFLAIPVMAMLKIILDSIDSLKPYGFLIGKMD